MRVYRPDIDGLRAVAVASVMVFHGDARWLPGGFIGVDIFFVLSGYLITDILRRDLVDQTFSFARFYLRRARRILPVLFVVLATTTTLGLVLSTPPELAALGEAAAATVTFSSNVLAWQDCGYFAAPSELKPLLHTWSLAIEEQFYLLWPGALIVARRLRLVRPFVAALLVGSFLLSCYGVARHPSATFYLLPTRAWELVAGAAIVVWRPTIVTGSWVSHVASISGATLVVAGLVSLDKSSSFPGYHALLPCAGTALLIAAGSSGVINRALSARPLVACGLISYSLYLWHWPLLTFHRLAVYGPARQTFVPLVLLLTVPLAVLSWWLVESPFRHGPARFGVRRTLAAYGVVSLAIGALGVALHAGGGLPWRVPPEVRAVAAPDDPSPLRDCVVESSGGMDKTDERCWLDRASAAGTIALWGDSHADALSPGVSSYARAHQMGYYQLSAASCPPLVDVTVVSPGADLSHCPAHTSASLDVLRRHPSIHTVVLSARWAAYAETTRFGADDHGSPVYLTDAHHVARSAANSKQVFHAALGRTLDALGAMGKKVVLVGPVPEMGIDVPRCLAHGAMWGGRGGRCDARSADVAERQAFVSGELDAQGAHDGVCVVSPRDVMCDETRCHAELDDRVLFRDDDHLSRSGALWLIDRIGDACLAPGPRAAQRGRPLPEHIPPAPGRN